MREGEASPIYVVASFDDCTRWDILVMKMNFFGDLKVTRIPFIFKLCIVNYGDIHPPPPIQRIRRMVSGSE